MTEQLDSFYQTIGYTAGGQIDTPHRIIIVVSVLALCFIVYLLCKKVVVPVLQKLVSKTSATWDDHLLNEKVTNVACQFLPLLLLYLLLPLAFHDKPLILDVVNKLTVLLIIAIGTKLILAFISTFYIITNESDKMRNKSLKGFYQMLKIVVVCISLILMFSIILDKRPEVLLTGLGASAAILMLVFKDSIMGLVAGVQINAYDMLRPGDWIKMDKFNADGIVTEVTLNIVKIRNWDNTIITIPTYLLVSDSFQNWRAMWESGRRRIKEILYIDVNSVHFCDEEEKARFEKLVKNCPATVGQPSNLHYFRYYMENYITQHPKVTTEPHMMVRLQPATEHGLPIEIYCFSANTQWIPYEHLKAELVEFALASLPVFGLKAFQSPTGKDISQLSK